MFGEIKGLKPHSSFFTTAWVILFIAEIIALAGYFDGFLDASGQFAGGQYQWSISTALYTAGMWMAFGLISLLLFRSKEDIKIRVGGAILSSLPLLVFFIALTR